MANYNKSFNFKNGVQVDVDKFIVRGSLVGIGTSIPGELFDVNGNIRVAGLVTTNNMNVTGIATFNDLRVGSVRLSADAGIITATAYYGDGSTLSNLPTSQWVDVDVGLGFTSIYAAGNVGVNTLDPRFSLQIGANPLSPAGFYSPYNLPGVGINSNGNIVTTGIISAISFSGIGAGLTSLNADNITLGSLQSSIIPIIPNNKLGPNLQLGIITATTRFVGDLTGYASTARSLEGNINILVGFVTTINLDVGIVSAQNLTAFNAFGVGIGSTVFFATHRGSVGVGTTLVSGRLDVVAPINSTLNVISINNESKISVGQSNSSGVNAGILRYGNPSGTLDLLNRSPGNMNFILHNGPVGTGTGYFNWRYGQTSQDLMSLTYDGKLGIGRTNPQETFEIVGTSTITGDAYFGGNVYVEGALNVSSVLFGQALNEVNVNTTSGVSTFNKLELISDILTPKLGINTTSVYPGAGIDARSQKAYFGGVGIGTTLRSFFDSGSGLDLQYSFQVTGPSGFFGGVGIGTLLPSAIDTDQINIYDTNINLYSTGYRGNPEGGILITAIDTNIVLNGDSNIAIGTFNPSSAFDLSGIGRATSSPGTAGQPGQAYMVLPKLNPTERSALVIVSGGLIYNTTTNQMQVYNGSVWQNLTHTNGSAANAGFATVSIQAGVSTIAAVAGFATNATRAGIATAASYAFIAGFSTYAGGVGFATFSGVAGFATVATRSGVSTLATYSYAAGIATVANQAGISTSVINGVANVTALRVSPGISTVGVLTATGSITDAIGDVRTYPQNSQSTLLAAYLLQASDVGKHVLITNATNGIEVPDDVFSPGDYVILVNGTGGTCNINDTGGGAAAVIRVAGNTSTTLPQVLAAYGVATLICTAANTFILYGQGVS